MNKVKLLFYSFLSIASSFVAWILYYLADKVAKYSNAWDQGADYYHNRVIERR